MTIYAACRFSDRPAACAATIRSAIHAIPPAQFIREHHQNAVDACRRRPGVKAHRIVWDSIDDLPGVAGLSDEFAWAPKLSVTDTGCGMRPEEMYRHLRTVFESGSEQSIDGNFGWGGRISGVAHSPFGVVYQSWVDGVGYTAQIEHDGDGNSGLSLLAEPDIFCEWAACVVPIDDEFMPDIIRDAGGYGTRVIFLGKRASDNTMLPPHSAPEAHWIARELNTRYMDPLDGITVVARCGYSRSNDSTNNETILGERHMLDHYADLRGVVDVDGASIAYWIIGDPEKRKGHRSRHRVGKAVGIVCGNEIYDVEERGSAEARLRSFGFYAGHSRVVIYVFPERAKPNIQRTSVSVDGMPPPWEEWASAFRANMPEEVSRWLRDITSGSDKDQDDVREWARDRILKSGLILGKSSGLRKHKSGSELSAEGHGDEGGRKAPEASGDAWSPNRGARPSTHKDKPIYKPRVKAADGEPSIRRNVSDMPDVKWCDTPALVEQFSMEGRPITFDRPNNCVVVNMLEDLFQVVVERLCDDRDYRESEESAMRAVAEEAIRRHLSAHICGTIMQIRGMAADWDVDRIDRALSDDAMLAMVAFVNGLMPAMRQDVAKSFSAKKEVA